MLFINSLCVRAHLLSKIDKHNKEEKEYDKKSR